MKQFFKALINLILIIIAPLWIGFFFWYLVIKDSNRTILLLRGKAWIFE